MKDADGPRVTRREICRQAKAYLEEMELWPGLEVVLIPAPDPRHTGHMIRACQSQNPPWYRKFAKQYENCRGIGRKQMKRPRTWIKRVNVQKALNRIAAGDFRFAEWPTARRLIDFMTIEISNRKTRDRVSKNLDADDDSSFDLNGKLIPF